MASNTGARTRECAAETTVSSLLTRARTSSDFGPDPCVTFPPSATLIEPMPGTTLEMSFQIFSTLSKTLETSQFHGPDRSFFSPVQMEEIVATPLVNRPVMVFHTVLAVVFIAFHAILSADSILLMALLIDEYSVFHQVVKKLEMAFHTVVIVDLIEFHRSEEHTSELQS